MRVNRFVYVVFVLALVSSSACQRSSSPTGPTDTFPPNNGPRAIMAWELWMGDPSCLSGCAPPPAQRLGSGAAGAFNFSSRTNTNHFFKLRVSYPQQAGHMVRTLVQSDARSNADSSGAMETWVDREASTGDRLLGLDTGRNFFTRSAPGTYRIIITVQDKAPDSSIETLQAELLMVLQ